MVGIIQRPAEQKAQQAATKAPPSGVLPFSPPYIPPPEEIQPEPDFYQVTHGVLPNEEIR